MGGKCIERLQSSLSQIILQNPIIPSPGSIIVDRFSVLSAGISKVRSAQGFPFERARKSRILPAHTAQFNDASLSYPPDITFFLR